MQAYKAFHKGLTCRGYQFKEGLNVTDQANCVKNGFHCAENPVDCLSYYPDVRSSEYWLVDAGGDIDEDACDSKIACTELTLLKRLSLKTYFLHCLIWLAINPKDRKGSNVHINDGKADRGYCIVYGEHPIARGVRKGDILALLQVNKKGEVLSLNVHTVGQKHIKPDVYYDVFGTEVRYV